MSSNKFKTPNRLNSALIKSAFPLANLPDVLKKNIILHEEISPIIFKLSSVHVTVSRYRQGTLEICTNEQSAANHLIYLKSMLINALKAHHLLPQLTDITIFIARKTIEDKVDTQCKTKKTHHLEEKSNGVNKETKLFEYISHQGLQTELLQLTKHLNK